MKVVQLMAKSQGGIRQHVAELTGQLSTRNIEVEVVAPPSTMRDLGVEQNDYPAISRKSIFSYSRAKAAIVPYIRDAHVVHAHGVTAGFLALRISRGRRPVIVTIHNLITKDRKGLRKLFSYLLTKYVMTHANHVIFPSKYAQDQSQIKESVVSSVILPVKKTISLHDRIAARDSREETRKKYGIYKEDVLYTCVARIHPQKDLSALVHAFATVFRAHPHSRLVIAGSGDQSRIEKLRQEIEKLGVTKAVLLVGYVDEPHILLAASDVCVLTSPHETVPFVMFESLHVGVPVVMCETGVASEVLKEELGASVPQGNTHKFAEKMQEYASRGSNKLDIEIREQIVDQWLSTKACVDPLVSLYLKSAREKMKVE